jgi:hypothetical protein
VAEDMESGRPRPPDMSTFTAYSRIEVDRHRQTVETWCVMVSIIGQVIADEHRGLLTVISLTQEQLEEIGSDKLPSFPWDPGVHFVSRMFYYMMTQVAPESHILHLGLVWSGPAGTCPMERGIFSLLIIMIGHGDGWAGTTSTEMFYRCSSGQQVQLPQVLQLEDPGVEDPVYIQGAVRHGQHSAVPAW